MSFGLSLPSPSLPFVLYRVRYYSSVRKDKYSAIFELGTSRKKKNYTNLLDKYSLMGHLHVVHVHKYTVIQIPKLITSMILHVYGRSKVGRRYCLPLAINYTLA